NLITLWGNEESPLHEYACRQWSGLLNDFYKPRWEMFFAAATSSLKQEKPLDVPAFQREVAKWEWKWVNKRKDYPQQTSGNPVLRSIEMYKKYRKLMADESYRK
ncbi:MAG: alpha-N-acetylglucosaminidase, partial [Sphingobacteriales bacterium]